MSNVPFNIPGFPGAPAGYPNPQTPPAAPPGPAPAFQAPPGYPAPPAAPQAAPAPAPAFQMPPAPAAPPGWPQQAMPAAPAAPPGWPQQAMPAAPAAPPGWPTATPPAPAAPQGWPQQSAPAGYSAQQPQYGQPPAQPQYGQAHGQYAPPGEDIAARIAAATFGEASVPRLTEAGCEGGYALEITKSGRRSGVSKRDNKAYDVIYVEFNIMNSTNQMRPTGTACSVSFNMLAGYDYEIKRMAVLGMALYKTNNPKDPRVIQVGAALAADQFVGRRLQAVVQQESRGRKNKNGEVYREAIWHGV